MFEAAKDPAIKLFGRTIALPESQASVETGENSDLMPMDETTEVEKKDICREATNGEVKDITPDNLEELDHDEADAASGLNDACGDDPKTNDLDDKTTADPKPEQEQVESDASGQEKVLKKPDKILPCPRCNSLDTKFCYYNNYNVNQPRHFCKNCQRYWTAGGTMRNVPVGAGRRKNKHSASHYRHLMMSSDGIPSPRVDVPDSTHGQVISSGLSTPTKSFKGNGTVLKFGPEAPLCESMANVLNLADQKRKAETSPIACGESRKELLCASSASASNCMENEHSENVARVEQNAIPGSCNGLTPMPPLHCFPGPPWSYPWSAGWGNIPALASGQCASDMAYGHESSCPNPIPWNPPPMMAPPAFCAPTIPFPFIPASFWGCMAGWPNGAWNVPWAGSNGSLSASSPTGNSGSSGNLSPSLGKHSRDTSLQVEEKAEKYLWVPKTLRIDDPDEAAKSSIWATLGIKPDKKEPVAKDGIFKSFQSRNEEKNHKSDATQVLHANPAALSRSHTFQEST